MKLAARNIIRCPGCSIPRRSRATCCRNAAVHDELHKKVQKPVDVVQKWSVQMYWTPCVVQWQVWRGGSREGSGRDAIVLLMLQRYQH